MQTKDHVIIGIGRFQPVHAGHHHVYEQIKALADAHDADHMVFSFPTHGDEKNPLTSDVKEKHMRIVLGTNNVFVHPEIKNPGDVFQLLHDRGYKKITIVAGGKRVEDFEKFRKYFGKATESKKTGKTLNLSKINPSNFQIHSVERDADSDTGGTEIESHMIDPRSNKMKIPFVSGSRMRSAIKDNIHTFMSMLPPHVTMDQAKELQQDLRKNMQALQEEVSAQTRMKLSRIAKRTAKIRAAKRKSRQRRRRNIKQLKKRAKQNVKGTLRHKFFKGSWQKLGFGTRANIDRNVNKRRKIADSMIKRILPTVIKGESERLNRLSTRRESVEELLLPLLLEARKGSRKVRSGKSGANSIKDRKNATARKQKQRSIDKQKVAAGDVSGRYAIVRARGGKYSGRTMIVDKDSYNPSVHDIVTDPKKFNLGTGQKLLDDDDFIQTDSSIELYGKIRGEDKASLKRSKGSKQPQFKDKKKSKTRVEKARESLMPKKPGKWDPVQGDIQPKRKQSKHCVNPTSHDAKIVEPGMAVFANMANGVSPEEQVKKGLIDEDTMMAILKNPHASLHPALQKMATSLQQKYGPNAIFKVTGRKLEGTKLSKQAIEDGIVDTTPKTDIQVINKDTGEIIDNASVKCGPSQAASGNWQDSYSAINWTANNADKFGIKLSKETIKELKDIADYLSGDEYGGYHKTKQGPSGLYTTGGELEGKDPGVMKKEKANKKLTDMMDKAFAKSSDAKALYNLTQMMGLHKFEEGSDAIARSMIAVSHDGSQVKIAPITLDLARKCKVDIASRIKSNSAASKQQEQEWDQLQEQAKKSGKKLTDLDDFRPYSLRNTIRVVINEIPLEQLKEDATPLVQVKGNKLASLILEKKQEKSPPVQSEEEMNSNFELLKELSKTNPEEFLKIIVPLFDYDDLSPTTDWLDVLPVEGYTFNRVHINGKEYRIPVEKPVDTPSPGVDVSGLGEQYLQEKRNYRKEYDNYHGKPEQRKNRAGRVKARRLLIKLGKVRKGDGKDVDHKDGNPRNNGKHNLRVRDKSSNRADND
jgi:hypothetical protein